MPTTPATVASERSASEQRDERTDANESEPSAFQFCGWCRAEEIAVERARPLTPKQQGEDVIKVTDRAKAIVFEIITTGIVMQERVGMMTMSPSLLCDAPPLFNDD